MMPTITLFSERRDLTGHSASFVGSIVVHCAVIAFVGWGIADAPQLNADIVTEHYTIRHLELHTPRQIEASAKSAVHYPGPGHESGAEGKVASESHKSVAQPSRQNETAHGLLAQAKQGPQTLIQPDINDAVTLKEKVPIPTVVLWEASNTPVKDIVAEQQETRAAADAKPSLDRPNDEMNLADVNLSASYLTDANIPVPAGTTSPVVVRGPEVAQAAPTTVSATATQPSPAAVLSISDLKMADGSVMLPPVNESVKESVPEPAQNNAPGNAAPGETQAANSNTNREASANTQESAAASQPAPAADDGRAENSLRSATAITLPRNGRFGSVVVGDSVEDEFPEMANMWGDRMAYTVYLHVGLRRSWILQYWLARSDDAVAAGNASHLDAPWPYNIVRPNIAPGAIAADALMVRGFVNQSGRFETLSIAFPESFPEAQFVLSALEQWQFRPAMQNGRSTAVEVLLIIPEELD